MARKKQLPPLEVGERFWMECRVSIYTKSTNIFACEIVRANGSSAYAVRVDDLGEPRPSEFRISQKTRKVYSMFFGTSYRIWETVEDYWNHLERVKELKELRIKANDKVANMNYSQLKQFVGEEV